MVEETEPSEHMSDGSVFFNNVSMPYAVIGANLPNVQTLRNLTERACVILF